jgi:hypothetical protein
VSPDSPGPFDAGLSTAREAVECIGVWLAIWEARREPDGFARRCASDAIGAADELLAATHRIRARLVDETRRADDGAAVRVDELLARDGHRSSRPGAANRSTSTAAPGAEAMRSQATLGRRHGGEPREATP